MKEKRKLLEMLQQAAGDLEGLKEAASEKLNGIQYTDSAGIKKLVEVAKELSEKEQFQVGELITIKSDELSMWRSAKEGTILIVTQVLEKPIMGVEADNETGSPYGALQFDIAAMTRDSDGDYLEHLYDSRFFKSFIKSA